MNHAITTAALSILLLTNVLYTIEPTLQKIFTHIYTTNGWHDPYSRSGTGSNLRRTTVIRTAIPALCKQLGVTIFLDAPCGDFYWMKEVDLGASSYIGIDIVPDLITQNSKLYGNNNRIFMHKDILHDDLPYADIIFCRDCLVHLSYRDIFLAINNFKKSGARYLLTTTFTHTKPNSDIETGQWRALNVELPPFNFPKPIMLIAERCTEKNGASKSLGLWLLADITV